MKYFYIYIALISIIAVFLTVHDKNSARKKKWRIKENILLLISVLGGSAAMLITMRITRHKTRHPKFMIGIPVIALLQIAAIRIFLL